MKFFNIYIRNSKKNHPEKTQVYLNKFSMADKFVNVKLNTEAFKINEKHVTEILVTLKSEKVTLISSTSHIRRGLSVFQEAANLKELNIEYSNLVYLDYPTLEEAQKVSEAEKLVIYRDLIRTSGIWAYPGI